MENQWKAALQNPPKAYRPVPFWSWNDRLESEETRRQIKEMDEQGMGGFFMHARGRSADRVHGSGVDGKCFR